MLVLVCLLESIPIYSYFLTGCGVFSCIPLPSLFLVYIYIYIYWVYLHDFCCLLEQKLIFERPPPNIRKILLATNMAEASITINDIVFVVDCGKAKETTYDALNNTPCLLPSWISRASARQVS